MTKPREVTLSSDADYNWKIVKPIKAEGPFPVKFIEAAPVLKMMDEMARMIEEFHPDDFVYDDGSEYVGEKVVKFLKSYKSFIAQNGLEEK